ncbi:MAG: hydantoinase B/oxoprolinase family protein [Acidimicrobiia bacterium]
MGNTSARQETTEGFVPDVIELELFRHAALSVVDEIEVNLTRTAYSPLIYEYKDYCVAILANDFGLLAQAKGSLPIFLGDISRPIADAVEQIGLENLELGDAFVTNHADSAGQHLNNVIVAQPLPGPEGGIWGYMAVRAHWADLGGLVPGSMAWASREIFHEGIQYRGIRVMRAGTLANEVLATIAANTRMPEYVVGDLMAQIAGCELGARRWQERVLQRWDTSSKLETLVSRQWKQSEDLARASVAKLPDGEFWASAAMDDQGVPGSPPLKITVGVRIEGDEMTVDLSKMPPQVEGPINAGAFGGGQAAIRVAFRSIVAPERAADEGLFVPLKLNLPDGTVVSAGNGAPMGRYNTTLPTLIDLVCRALGQEVPELVPAGHHGTMGAFFFHWRDEDGRWHQLVDTAGGGWGAHANGDGFSPLKTMFHGDNRDIPVEIVEAEFPMRVHKYGFVADTGGPGKYRGGLGTERLIEIFDECRLEASMERTTYPGWGMAGGESGTTGGIFVKHPGETDWTPMNKGGISIQSGSQVRIQSAGGGGWGRPADRNPLSVRNDLLNGYVTKTDTE